MATNPGCRSDRKPTILLIGPDEPILDRATALGVSCVVIEKPKRLRTTIVERSIAALALDYEDYELVLDTVRALASRIPIDSAVSFTEQGLMPAALLNEALGLPGVTVRAVELTRDKGKMRDAVRAIHSLECELVGTPAAAIAFGERVGWPIVLKPTDGVGSRGVEKIAGAAGVEAYSWSGAQYLVERYVAGNVVSVDSFSFGGHHVLYAINEQFPIGDRGPSGSNPLVHTRHMLPAAISEKAVAGLWGLLPRVLDALDVRDGPSHTEFIISDDAPWLVECHTRVGGASIPEMLQRCTGIDLLSMTIAWPLGLINEPPEAIWTSGAALQLFLPEPGRVDQILGAESSVDLPGIAQVSFKVKPGDYVPPLRGFGDNVGHVMAIAATSEEAFAACERVRARVQIPTSQLA